MKRIFITVLTLGILTFTALHWQKAPEPAGDSSADPSASSSAQPSPVHPTPQRPAISNNQNPPATVRPELSQESLLAQARAMNRILPTAQAAKAEQNRLEDLAASLTEADRALLVEKVTSASTGDNIRALALYLLTLAPSTTPENLKAIALMPNPVAGQPLVAHTPEEWADRTVKAFATGAVAELHKRLKTDPSLVRELQEISEQAPIPLVKRIAKSYVREADSRGPASLKRRKK